MKKQTILYFMSIISIIIFFGLFVSCSTENNALDNTTEAAADVDSVEEINSAAQPINIENANEIGKVKILNLSSISDNYIIEKADGDSTSVEITGHEDFVDIIEMDYSAETGTLRIYYDKGKTASLNVNKWDESKNTIKVKMAYDGESPENLIFKIEGSGSINLSVPFKKLNMRANGSGMINAPNISVEDIEVTINGSGNINFNDANYCNITINGSGSAKFNHAENSVITVNGSGDINFKSSGSCDVTINGSGNVSGTGKINLLNSAINGSGDMKFSECDKFTGAVGGSGAITVDKVNESISATITVPKGASNCNSNIEIKSGEVETFYAYIYNKSDSNKLVIDAKNVTADNADITIEDIGTVKIKKVKNDLIQNCGENADLIVSEE
jgi:Protein of unknown function (DUF2807).